jgi:hypothetical protein
MSKLKVIGVKAPDHAVFDIAKGVLRCTHCRRTHPVPLPSTLNRVVEMGEAWSALHRDCSPPEARVRPGVANTSPAAVESILARSGEPEGY